MQESSALAEYGSRIARALDRISAAAEAATPQAGSAEVETLREALEAERATSAQLAERLRAVRQSEADARAALEAQIEELAAEIGALRAQAEAAVASADPEEIAAVIAALVPLIEEAENA
jgi:chromosome segregation protein